MANDRLYIGSREHKVFCCIAKGWSNGWDFKYPDSLETLLKSLYLEGWGDTGTDLELFTESRCDTKTYNWFFKNAGLIR